ncbi:2OG-Fe(II) oxygenase [Pandoraea commovens]|uniref:2OG-Fe(II) oxygenase n=1 Tax=Pandoraea commovens TaxID=2508289 RepID=A0A5E4W6K8_9BURK|nr:2OG-Fe(II) oxygenase [Pandoraea commovens]UVA81549.1 2OG-Fe(II) oxygenase [Pandoraea commovens]VVE19713.1 PKHD-type hydroxylase [Pandoraea commovens]
MTPSPLPPALYRVWPSHLPDEFCDLLYDTGRTITLSDAAVVSATAGVVHNEKARKSKVGFFDNAHWISRLCLHYGCLANRELWQYDIAEMQGTQFSTYEAGDFFNWHRDSAPDAHPIPDHPTPLRRVVTVIIMLSDGGSYEGGDFMLRDASHAELKDPAFREKGSVVVFPGYVLHQVTRMVSGHRASIVGWLMGP